MSSSSNAPPVALVTGAARRIGAAISRELHRRGFELLVHYNHSASEAQALADELNEQRAGSCHLLQASLEDPAQIDTLCQTLREQDRPIAVLVNNASSFYPTPLPEASQHDWDTLFASNARGPYFLCQGLLPLLQTQGGVIINLIDAMHQHPPTGYSIYAIAKSALATMTLSLARELAPEIRVNGVAPGAILWPEHEAPESTQQQTVIKSIPLGRMGDTQDIAGAVSFLACDAPYITGQILHVDGGRSL